MVKGGILGYYGWSKFASIVLIIRRLGKRKKHSEIWIIGYNNNMGSPSIDITTSFPSSYFPEVRDLLLEFSDCYQPIEGLDLWDVYPPDWDLPKRMYEDCFKYPNKAFYWRLEQEAPRPETKSGQDSKRMSQLLLGRLSEKFGAEIEGETVKGWKAHRSKFKNVKLWTRHRREMKAELEKRGIEVTGSFYYPPGGYREWHTNADKTSGWRMYYVRVLENEKSWFHYVNPSTNELVKVPDKDDYFHLFYLTDLKQVMSRARPEYFWHNVVSHTHRRSFGLQVSAEMVNTIFERLEKGAG